MRYDLARQHALRRRIVLAAGLWALLAPGCGRPSVLLVGIDGADWDVIDVLVEAEALPTLAWLVERGVRADLDCTPAMPETSCFCPPVWTSVATGQPEAVHGLRTVA